MLKDNFFGRQNYLEILEKRVRSLKNGYRQNLAIIGDELVGKTSIVTNFLDSFCDPYIIPVYLELKPETLSSFAKRFIAALLYNFLINSNVALKEDLGFLIEKSARYLPHTLEKINAILRAIEKRSKNNIFPELLSLCESINKDTGKYCLIIFDEFHNLESLGINNLYRDWSNSLILQKSTMHIITSSMKFKTRVVLSKNLSLLFGNFELIQVEPFDTNSSEEYLDQKLTAIRQINPGIKNFIVNFSGGYPFYLDLILDAFLKTQDSNLVDALEGLFFDTCGILNQKFSNYLKCLMDNPFSQDYISILHLVSSGHNKIKDLAHILRKTTKDLNLRINRLLELDIIVRSGDFLRISDRVFSFWLKFVHKEKSNSLTFDAKNQRTVFRSNTERLIQEFISSAQRPITERMNELLHLFKDEVVQIEKKKMRLDQFREIKSLEFNRNSFKDGLIGRSQDSLWIMAFKYDSLTEEDITEFSRECKKYRHKLQKKIIIALKDIDANARLRALEEKILTWDVNNINQILDLFYRPQVII